jgi:peptide chain release factor subunit 1
MASIKSYSLENYRFRKLLEELKSKIGRGTELISLYVPPGRPIHEVINGLWQEYNTASNIKSDRTRKNVQSAIERVIQRLRYFKKTPENGLVVFCGAIPQDGEGSERLEDYVIIPPEPINVSYYGCSSTFYLDPLYEIIRERESYGVIILDSSEASFGIISGRRIELVREITSGIPGKHRAGGQSARRFERLREMELNEFFRRVAKYADELFLDRSDIKGILVAGPGPTKYEFLDKDYLNYMLKQKVVGVIDTAYTGEEGLREVASKSVDILRGVRHMDEKRIVQRFFKEATLGGGLAAYGEDEVRSLMERGMVETLIISEGVDRMRVTVECGVCSYTDRRTVRAVDLFAFEAELSRSKCPSCGNQSLKIKEKKNLIDDFIELAERYNVNVELISTETEEGEMFLKGFGGIAALLRYKV